MFPPWTSTLKPCPSLYVSSRFFQYESTSCWFLFLDIASTQLTRLGLLFISFAILTPNSSNRSACRRDGEIDVGHGLSLVGQGRHQCETVTGSSLIPWGRTIRCEQGISVWGQGVLGRWAEATCVFCVWCLNLVIGVWPSFLEARFIRRSHAVLECYYHTSVAVRLSPRTCCQDDWIRSFVIRAMGS